MSEILTGGDIAALRPFGDNGFRVGDRFYSVREMLDTIARAAARVAELEEENARLRAVAEPTTKSEKRTA